jgi:thiamine biosynthesis protein ThiC
LTILSSLFAAAMARCRDMWAATASETGGSPTPLIQQIKKKKNAHSAFASLEDFFCNLFVILENKNNQMGKPNYVGKQFNAKLSRNVRRSSDEIVVQIRRC